MSSSFLIFRESLFGRKQNIPYVCYTDRLVHPRMTFLSISWKVRASIDCITGSVSWTIFLSKPLDKLWHAGDLGGPLCPATG